MRKPVVWQLSLQAWLALWGLGLILWLTFNHADLLLEITWILFGAFLLSLAVRPLVDRLARRHIPRGLTVLAVYLGLLGGLVLLGALLVPVVSAEIALVRADGPDLLQKAFSRLAAIPFLGPLVPSLDTLTQNLAQYLAALFPTFLSTVAGVGGITIDLVVVLILAYFFAADAAIGSRLLRGFIPGRYQPQVSIGFAGLRFRLTRWIWAQVAIAFYFALTFGIGATLLGVPFALTIALVGGVFEVIPYVGGAIALVLALLSALTVDPWLAVWVILLYTVVVQVQSHLVAPAFYRRAMHLHPAAVLVALLIGAKAKGIIGVFFAVPVAVVLLTLLQELSAARQATEAAVEPIPAPGQAQAPDSPRE